MKTKVIALSAAVVFAMASNVQAVIVTGTMRELDGTVLNGVAVTVEAVAPNQVVIASGTFNDGQYTIDVPGNDPNINQQNQFFNLNFSRDGQVTRHLPGLSSNGQNMTIDTTVPRAQCRVCYTKHRRGLFGRRHR